MSSHGAPPSDRHDGSPADGTPGDRHAEPPTFQGSEAADPGVEPADGEAQPTRLGPFPPAGPVPPPPGPNLTSGAGAPRADQFPAPAMPHQHPGPPPYPPRVAGPAQSAPPGHPPVTHPAGPSPAGPAFPGHPQPHPHTAQIPAGGGPLPPGVPAAGVPGPPFGVPPPRRRTGLVVAIIVALVGVVAALIGGFLLFGGATEHFGVGTCVVPHGQRARATDCGTSGSYRITKRADTRAQCPDPDGPVVDLKGIAGPPIRCLAPVRD